ncbi:MAG TPA: hypothetical protein ENF34_03045 [Candidatus Bathyarchaeota archaeon]|nr:hypothetical protein [Candidatus Bathyarchaeota archaeon]
MSFWEHLRRALEHVMDSIMARIWGIRESEESWALTLEKLINWAKRLLDKVKEIALRLEKMRDEYRKLAKRLIGEGKELYLSLIQGLAKLEESVHEGIKKTEEPIEFLESLDRMALPDEEALERMRELFYEVREFILEHFFIANDFRAISPVQAALGGLKAHARGFQAPIMGSGKLG